MFFSVTLSSSGQNIHKIKLWSAFKFNFKFQLWKHRITNLIGWLTWSLMSIVIILKKSVCFWKFFPPYFSNVRYVGWETSLCIYTSHEFGLQLVNVSGRITHRHAIIPDSGSGSISTEGSSAQVGSVFSTTQHTAHSTQPRTHFYLLKGSVFLFGSL